VKFELVKTKTGYRPPDEESTEKSKQVHIGEIVVCHTSDQRHLAHHRKFMALIKLCHENLPESLDGYFPTPDDLRYELTRRAGFYREYTDLKGIKQYIPESIAFDKMGQERFQELYDRVLDLCCKVIGAEREDIMEQLAEF
jgi:hypothetical protein